MGRHVFSWRSFGYKPRLFTGAADWLGGPFTLVSCDKSGADRDDIISVPVVSHPVRY